MVNKDHHNFLFKTVMTNSTITFRQKIELVDVSLSTQPVDGTLTSTRRETLVFSSLGHLKPKEGIGK